MFTAFHVRFACVSMTPFGAPVVPDVCGMRHTSSSVTAAVAQSRGTGDEGLEVPVGQAVDADHLHVDGDLGGDAGLPTITTLVS